MRHRCIRIVAPLVTLVAVLSCGGAEGIAPPTSAAIPSRADSTLLAGLIVSGPVANPVSASNRSTAGPTAALDAEVSYVSLVPGTITDGSTATTIANLRTGQRVAVWIVDGGFDPQAIPANLGDTLQVMVSRREGQPEAVAYMAVAARLGPRIVRTQPPRGQMDAPLNTIITLVFSEPLDPTSVNATSVALSTGSSPVAGAVRLQDGPGDIVEFTPSGLLVANTTYSLSVSGVANLAGTALATPASLTVTTGTSLTSASAVPMTISPDSITMNLGEQLQIRATVTDATGQVLFTPSNVTWISSSPDIVRVECCAWVTGIGAGTAVITARSQTGDVGTARITVKFATTPAGEIVLAACGPNFGPPCGLFAVDPDGSKAHFLTAGYLDVDPAWSPDGTFIAFRSRRACSAALICPNDLYLVKSDGSGIRSLTTGRGLDVGGMSWSPDGSRLVFAASVFPPDQSGGEALYVINADGTGLQRLVSGPPGGTASWPDWSPDGTRIVYNVAVDGASAIHLVDPDGSNDVRISMPAPASDAFRPHWSPDGKRVAFMSLLGWSDDEFSFLSQAFVMNADGSNLTPVTQVLQNGWSMPTSSAAWSPDGTRLALDFGMPEGVGVVNVDGSGGVQFPLPSSFSVISGISWRRTAAAVPVPAQSRARP